MRLAAEDLQRQRRDPARTTARHAAGTGRRDVYRQTPMLKALLITWALLAVAFAITGWILPGMSISGGVIGYLWVTVVFGIVNAIIGTLLRIVTFPLRVITLGLFSFVVNALLLVITDALTSHLEIDDFFWTAIWASVIMALASLVLHLALRIVLRA
jgi:putative membrane protein